MKATEQELALHQRIVARDPRAFNELATWLYDSLVRQSFRRAGTNADPHLVEEAVGEALLDYNEDPTKYDPRKMSLTSYLLMAAYWDYRDAYRIADRYVGRWDELPDGDQGELSDDGQEVEQLMRTIWHREQLKEVIHQIPRRFPMERDQQVMYLILEKERTTKTYAKVLGIEHLPVEEQRHQVHQTKDRIKKRLKRLGGLIDD